MRDEDEINPCIEVTVLLLQTVSIPVSLLSDKVRHTLDGNI